MKQSIINNLKNIPGWKTRRKIIVFSVDDYGNVRLDSRRAREKMDAAGLGVRNRFDAFDALETREDLEQLFDSLSSVKDSNGNFAKITSFTVPCNIDFERMAQNGYSQFFNELLPITFKKVSALYPKAYEGTWSLWKEGIKMNIFVPQFHGREHLNLKVFNEKLASRDLELLTALKNRSYTSISDSGYSTISYTAAFEFWEFKENQLFDNIILDGLAKFHQIFDSRATYFNPPGGREHHIIHRALKENGIKYLDTPRIQYEHQGKGKHNIYFNYTGKYNRMKMVYLVRNVLFEPTYKKNIDWVQYALKQIETAFRWYNPAIISSHRVNFCGHINEKNREIGINSLKELLKAIVNKWPEVEFFSADELGNLIENDRK